MLIKFQTYILAKYSTRTATVVRAISRSPVQPSKEGVAVEGAMPDLARQPSGSTAPVRGESDVCENLFLLLILVEEFTLSINIF